MKKTTSSGMTFFLIPGLPPTGAEMRKFSSPASLPPGLISDDVEPTRGRDLDFCKLKRP